MLLNAGFTDRADHRARQLVKGFREFIETHKDEIEALQILYSRPHRAGLRYSQVKDLLQAIKRPPLNADAQKLWDAFEQTEPDQQTAGVSFTAEQTQWLDAIKDHIASSLAIDSEDFSDIPFNQLGGLGRAYELFGDSLTSILEELNARLAA
ncbi:MAG: hypothetical protein KDA91_20665 [Planctomycetaceae bacterium]|nr:hypothetical protein [Planctomycetaceae bacterium]